MREHDDEPVPGLPEDLPEGETILWQGKPATAALARDIFHWRLIALWCALWGIVRFFEAYESVPLPEAMASGLGVIPVALLGLGILWFIAWLTARTTLYTITDKRVAMKIGIALTLIINIPYRRIGSAALKLRGRTGDIPLALNGQDKFAWVMLWPHVRPWRLKQPEPMLRGVREPGKVAEILGDALARYNATHPASAPQRSAVTTSPATGGAKPQGAFAAPLRD